jgi:hypothetical protein
MAVDEHQPRRGLARQQRVGEAYLGKDAPEGVGLGSRVSAPVLWIGQQVAGADADQGFDAITDRHGFAPMFSARRARDGG